MSLRDSIAGSLMAYSCAMDTRYEPAAHHRLIASTLEKAYRGEKGYDRVMLFAPPRHGKSELVSVKGPAWFLGNWPERKMIAASHTVDLAEGFGAKIRNMINDPLHLSCFGKNAALDPGTTARGNFSTAAGGSFFAVGVGGTPIGKGGDVITIDDPIRSREDAESPSLREKLKSWYTSAIYSRREGNGTIILMHQRWHDDDLAGWLLREHSQENWKVVNLPAIAEEGMTCELGRVPGEALWWKKYDEAELNRTRIAMGARDWMSMYQQRPRSETGDEFKKNYLRFYTKPNFEVALGSTIYILVDAATSKKRTSDFTAMAVIAIGGDGNKYLLELVRDKLSLVQRAAKLIALHRKWKPRFVGYEQYGQMADIEHIYVAQEEENYRFSISPLGGQSRKTDRIRRMLPDLENGKWWFPEEMWTKSAEGKYHDVMVNLVEEEMMQFPAGAHDDALDAMSRIYDMNQVTPKDSKKATGQTKKGPQPW